MSQEKLSPFFCIVVFRRERYDTKEAVRRDVEPHVLLHVRANGDASMTHKRWEHGQSGHESTDYTLSVVPYVGGWLALPIDKEPMEALAGSWPMRPLVKVDPKYALLPAGTNGAIEISLVPRDMWSKKEFDTENVED